MPNTHSRARAHVHPHMHAHIYTKSIYPFTPEFLKWAHPPMNLDTSIVVNRGISQKSRTEQQTVDPDETAHHEPSPLDLHCLHKYLVWSTRLKGLKPPTLFCTCLKISVYHFCISGY